MTVHTGPARAGAQASWLAAGAAALLAVAAVNALAGGDRWWANFVLLPGAAVVAAAVPLLRAGRRQAAAGYAVLSVGAIVSAVGALLLFGAVGRGWPLLIIVPCLAIAGTARWRAADPGARAGHRTVVGLAVLGALLGLAFVALRSDLVDFGDTNWWGYFMVAAGVVAIGNGLTLVRDLRGYRLSTLVLLAGPGAAAILAGLRELS
jgi:hypothetical protein